MCNVDEAFYGHGAFDKVRQKIIVSRAFDVVGVPDSLFLCLALEFFGS